MRKMSGGNTDYDFSRPPPTPSQQALLRPPGTPNRQYGISQTPRTMQMPMVPSTPMRLGTATGSGMGLGGGLARSPRLSIGPPGSSAGIFALPATPGGLGRAQQTLAPTLGGQTLNQGSISPRGMGSSYGTPGSGIGGMPISSNRTTQLPGYGGSNNLPGYSQSFRGGVDSKSEYKSDYPSRLARAGSFIGNSVENPRDALGELVGGGNGGGYGSNGYSQQPPKNVSIPRPYVSQNDSNANGRTAGGNPYWSPPRPDFADPGHVPRAGSALSMLEQADHDAVGPNRPTKPLNDVWSACWDDEVNATYYYNHQTGEATWILPEGL